MKTVLFTALVLSFLSGCAETFGTYSTVDTFGEIRSPGDLVGQAWLVGQPRYPKAELARGANGYVVLDARVSPQGELEDVRFAPESSGPPAFVDAVRDALPMWRFYPPLDQDCQATRERIKVRVWFEAEGGVPKINVHGEGPAWKGDNQPKPISTQKPLYPWKISAMRWEDGVTVFVKASIDAEGNVADASVKAYPRYLSWITLSFEDATKTAVLGFKFPPAQSGTAGHRYYCTDVIFAAK